MSCPVCPAPLHPLKDDPTSSPLEVDTLVTPRSSHHYIPHPHRTHANAYLQEFSIDIIGEDNKTTIHHKVAARVMCVFMDEDAHLAAHVKAIPTSASLPPNIPSVLPPSAPPYPPEPARWHGRQLQGELQKSHDTGAELHSLSSSMNDIHDMLSGLVPQNLPHFHQLLPPVRSQQASTTSAPTPTSATPTNLEPPAPPPEHPGLSKLHSELHETQANLASHVDKVCALEDMLAEHEAIKAEVAALRDLIHASSAHSQHDNGMHIDLECGHCGHDDDDTSSIHTITLHELEHVEEEDESEEQDESEEDRECAQRREELGRPRTLEPS
ncbi:hypothetical protein DEU56DRAFT_929839 [Suillus clintonianus]|uniref:uncharacterized protein n=1 Tax=Suillus clintonianus TaxID=1904413 RepID=UPI001B871D82|nr:uncharacterized protein DEU56DRAFT_929839 [Suillus clintonianus]KAG2118589.1 hypothetical protein DEU56DRAFT_929839 [Suillus clintonianus]